MSEAVSIQVITEQKKSAKGCSNILKKKTKMNCVGLIALMYDIRDLG